MILSRAARSRIGGGVATVRCRGLWTSGGPPEGSRRPPKEAANSAGLRRTRTAHRIRLTFDPSEPATPCHFKVRRCDDSRSSDSLGRRWRKFDRDDRLMTALAIATPWDAGSFTPQRLLRVLQSSLLLKMLVPKLTRR